MQPTTVDLIDRYTVGWSDLLLFFDLSKIDKLHPIRYIFTSSISELSKFYHASKFSFKKNHKDLANYFLGFEKIFKYLHFTSMNTGQKENFNHFILGLQNGQNGL